MFQGFARCLLLAGISGSALLGCSSDATPENGGGAGMASGGASGGNATGGSSTSAGTSNHAGTTSGGTASGGTASSGTASGGSATGGSATGGNATGGSGGASGGSANGGGGAGGGATVPTAVANITGLMGKDVTGTATFTQGATMTTLVLNLTACPNGAHASHLHLVKNCGDNGNAAGGHWQPNGEGLPDYTCADNKGSLTFMKPTSMWTVGDNSATDVTKYAFMVHETGGTDPGGRIGCGVVNKQ